MVKILCPICKGKANNRWLDRIQSGYAYFVVECWSGDLNKASRYHYFEAKIKLPRSIEINQIADLEKELTRLEEELEALKEEIRLKGDK